MNIYYWNCENKITNYQPKLKRKLNYFKCSIYNNNNKFCFFFSPKLLKSEQFSLVPFEIKKKKFLF
jgi:hypothetical protein